MLLIVGMFFLTLWLVGLGRSYMLGGFIYVALLIGFIFVVVSLVPRARGRRHWERKKVMFQPIGILWGIVTLVFGILVIAFPKFLRYSVGIYLIVAGAWAILPRLHF
jgi:hypothetical protein